MGEFIGDDGSRWDMEQTDETTMDLVPADEELPSLPCTCRHVVFHFPPQTMSYGPIYETTTVVHEPDCARFRRRRLRAV